MATSKERGVAKGAVTRIATNIDALMLDTTQPEEVKKHYESFHDKLAEFLKVHEAYTNTLDDDSAKADSAKYLVATMKDFNVFKERVDLWLAQIDEAQSEYANPMGGEKDSEDDSTEEDELGKEDQEIERCLQEAEEKLRRLEHRESLRQRQFELDKHIRQRQLEAKHAEEERKDILRRMDEELNCQKDDGLDMVGPTYSTPKTAGPTSRTTTVELPSGIPAWQSPSSSAPSATEASTLAQVLREFLNETRSSQQSMVDTLQLPNLQLIPFNGDPLKYWSFIRSFRNAVDNKATDQGTKLSCLVQYCTGKARNLIECCLVKDPAEGYELALRLLEERFGNNYDIAQEWVNKIIRRNPVKADLREFADELRCCQENIRATGHSTLLDNSQSMRAIVEKLPSYLHTRWLSQNHKIKSTECRIAQFDDLVKFVNQAAEEVSDPIYGNLIDKKNKQQPGDKQKGKQDRRARGFATQAAFGSGSHSKSPGGQTKPNPKALQVPNPVSGANKDPCFLCGGRHVIVYCDSFLKMRPQERVAFVQGKGRCVNCYAEGHSSKTCSRSSFCKLPGCEKKHSTFLHLPLSNTAVDAPAAAPIPEAALDAATTSHRTNPTGTATTVNCSVSCYNPVKVALPIVPVRVRSDTSKNYVDTYALLDTGADQCFCTKELAECLGAHGTTTKIELSTLDATATTETNMVKLQISDIRDQECHDILAFTRPNLAVQLSSRITEEDLQKWPHLHGIDIPNIDKNEVQLVLGASHPEAFTPTGPPRIGNRGEPYATPTIFGWAVNGPVGAGQQHRVTSCFARTKLDLQAQVERFWEIEDIGAKQQPTPMSISDRKVLDNWDRSTQLTGGHYTMGIPFKVRPHHFPDNRSAVLHRLKLTGKRLKRDPDMLEMYTATMRDLIAKGFAERVPEEDVDKHDGMSNYIPHHSVRHPRKPDKLRVVWDCAAKFQGLSLNDRVHQGPDLANKLVGVLMRFRQEPVAFMADIEAMFSQVYVSHGDRDALRYLWWEDNDISKEPVDYRLTTHLFGGVWSPSAANYALRRCAIDNEADYDTLTFDTVQSNFYVDDCLKSVSETSTAIHLASQLTGMLAKGGFRLTKWISNDKGLLQTIPSEEHAKGLASINFDLDQLPTEHALGVLWHVENDSFGFEIHLPEKPKTRRGVLSSMSSVYDPLGFVSPYILRAKLIFQSLCRRNLGWDERIPDDLQQQWDDWLHDLPQLKRLDIPRCIRPCNFVLASAALHHFADASQVGYGAVSYLRLQDTTGILSCSLIMSKSKLAPIKGSTIPRLELTAAVEAVKLDRLIRQELELPLQKSTFWTDSMIVLWYICQDDKRFQTFVANRVAYIREYTAPGQWRHVSTKDNPADDTSRGMSAIEVSTSTRWLQGPAFLRESEVAWPPKPVLGQTQPDEAEVKRELQAHSIAVNHDDGPVSKLLLQYSSWYRLQKAVAWFLRLKKKLLKRDKQPAGSLRVIELHEARVAIVQYVQRKEFGLNLAEFIESGKLCKLVPFLSLQGLLCVGGRLKHSNLLQDAKHPWILPNSHHITKLIVEHFHAASGHSGPERVLAEIRQTYWPVKGRSIVKSVLRKCIPCKRAKAVTMGQIMADLPPDRVTPGDPPFTWVGVDYFGPLMVKRGRSELKRYGCLFTCLTTRAVHIEMSESLETDSFINALETFCELRGRPRRIRSDNGTNFVGAKAELSKALASLDQKAIHSCLRKREIEWVFNPPAASHMDGIWERQIRTVRSILLHLCRHQLLNDECLRTYLYKAMGIINSRPITKLSDDPSDIEPLTPNHLLLLRPSGNLAFGTFVKEDLYRRRWRQVQYMTDQFWTRWVREYLPSLQERQRWTRPSKNLEVGCLVLVQHEKTPRGEWPLGLITEVYPGKDGKVRSAQIRFRGGLYHRPVHKLCLLEGSNSIDSQ